MQKVKSIKLIENHNKTNTELKNENFRLMKYCSENETLIKSNKSLKTEVNSLSIELKSTKKYLNEERFKNKSMISKLECFETIIQKQSNQIETNIMNMNESIVELQETNNKLENQYLLQYNENENLKKKNNDLLISNQKALHEIQCLEERNEKLRKNSEYSDNRIYSLEYEIRRLKKELDESFSTNYTTNIERTNLKTENKIMLIFGFLVFVLVSSLLFYY
jgi:FtsZ-binding cell division protein ZapB